MTFQSFTDFCTLVQLLLLYACEALAGTCLSLFLFYLHSDPKKSNSIYSVLFGGADQKESHIQQQQPSTMPSHSNTNHSIYGTNESVLSIYLITFAVITLSKPIRKLFFGLPEFHDDFARPCIKRMVLIGTVCSGSLLYTYVHLRTRSPKGLRLFQTISPIFFDQCDFNRSASEMFTEAMYFGFYPLLVVASITAYWTYADRPQRDG